MKTYLSLITLISCLSIVATAWAEPTQITVRVISKGAKFVGSSMGGVQITVHDTDTGQLLASGVTQGGTGDTQRIMQMERQREAVLSTEGSAQFTTSLDIHEPRRIKVTAYGPLAQRQAANEVSATQWLVPGKHISGGDGFLLELPGLVVDVLDPPTHLKLSGTPQTIQLKANVTMMCGCPVEPNGLWDANQFEIKAVINKDGKPVTELPLTYAGTSSQFAATWQVDKPGLYEATVYAYDPANGNTGLDRTTFIVEQ